MQLQEYDFDVEYIQGSTNVVAYHLSRAPEATLEREDCTCESVVCGVAGGIVPCSSSWPAEAAKQSDFDSVVCDVCQDPGFFDNMAICSGCNRYMHLRCIMPPMSTVPTGEWYCPGCDPLFGNLDQMYDATPILKYTKL
jgi:hypothetical protein